MSENDVNTMSQEQAALALAELAAQIRDLDDAYHGTDAPLVSDGEYDALRQLDLVSLFLVAPAGDSGG